MKSYTPQTAFNKIWRHFIRDRQPRGYKKDQGCRYRSNGHKCAVGIFIPDSEYTPDLENSVISELRIFDDETLAFMDRAQDIHDAGMWYEAENWPADSEVSRYNKRRFLSQKPLRKLAKEFNLEIPTT